MKKVNAKYHKFLHKPRIVELKYTTITRRKGHPEVTTSGISIVKQEGFKARMEMLPGTTFIAAHKKVPARLIVSHKKHVWTFNNKTKEFRNFYETHPSHHPRGETVVHAYKHRTHALSKHFQNPLANDEIPKEMFQGKHIAKYELLGTKRVITIASVGKVAFNPDTSVKFKIWIDPKKKLLLRMDTDKYHWIRHGKKPELVHVSTKIEARMMHVKDIDDAEFSLKLPKNAKDLTRHLQKNIQRFAKQKSVK